MQARLIIRRVMEDRAGRMSYRLIGKFHSKNIGLLRSIQDKFDGEYSSRIEIYVGSRIWIDINDLPTINELIQEALPYSTI